MSRIGILHTSLAFLLSERVFLPLETRDDLVVQHFVDSRLLADFRTSGGLNGRIMARFASQVQAAQESDCDILISACSSLGRAADVAANEFDIPILKIDEPMAQEAARIGGTVGVLATVESTVQPSSELVVSHQRRQGRPERVVSEVCISAFDALMLGDKPQHDDMVVDAALSLSERCDVIVLAQASMARLQTHIASEVRVPVLASPALAFAELDVRLSAARTA